MRARTRAQQLVIIRVFPSLLMGVCVTLWHLRLSPHGSNLILYWRRLFPGSPFRPVSPVPSPHGDLWPHWGKWSINQCNTNHMPWGFLMVHNNNDKNMNINIKGIQLQRCTVSCDCSPPVPYFPSDSRVFGLGLEDLVCGAGPGCNNTSSAVSRCRQSDLPGTPWRIRGTSAGTGTGATWGDVSHVGFTSQDHRGAREQCWRTRHQNLETFLPDRHLRSEVVLLLSGLWGVWCVTLV